MTTLNIFYTADDDNPFDADYYVNKHIPLALEIWGDTVKDVSVARGLGSPDGSAATYALVVQIEFRSQQAFEAALSKPGNDALKADIPNFTKTSPKVQVGKRIYP